MLEPTPHITPEMLKAYVNGELTSAERHVVEHAALRDAAVRDILEGYEQLKESKTNLSAVNNRLKGKLQGRIEKSEKRNVIIWWKYGMAASLLFGTIIGSYLIFNNLEQDNLALEASPVKVESQEIPPSPEITYEQEMVEEAPEPPVPATNESSQNLLRKGSEPIQRLPVASVPKLGKKNISAEIAESDAANSTAFESAAKSVKKQEVEDIAVAAAPAARSAKRVAAAPKQNNMSGKVTDNQGEPLPGVTISLRGKTTGTTTDATGNFELPNISPNDKLGLSHIGFTPREVTAKDVTKPIVLTEDTAALQEMVVTGYGKTLPDQEATPKNGWDSFRKDLIISSKTEGEVVLVLTISPEGKVTAKEIKKGLGEPYDSQALNLAIFNEPWTPTRKNGKAVEQEIRVTVRFKAN